MRAEPPGLLAEQLHLEIIRRLQLTLLPDQRERVARQVAGAINTMLEAAGIAPFDKGNAGVVGQLFEDGYVELGQLLAGAQVDDVLGFLAERRVAGDYVPAHASAGLLDKTAAEAAELPHVSYPIEDILRAPHLLELANSTFMLGLAQAYLGCVPTLYSVNLMIARPTRDLAPNLQTFHRDYDDFRFVTLFVYLSDIERDEHGPHVYVRGSQRPDEVGRRADALSNAAGPATLNTLYGILNPDIFFDQHAPIDAATTRYLSDRQVRIKGPPGTAFLVDTFGLHKGIPPAAGDRIVFWARYGLYANLACATVNLAPLPWSLIGQRLPDDARSRYVNRLLLA
ncbi:MAG: hypothetical protein HY060_24870 [Proteobacteria bacterium]|nr:hypothetical protein [Pseudomonadota bacterium]